MNHVVNIVITAVLAGMYFSFTSEIERYREKYVGCVCRHADNPDLCRKLNIESMTHEKN